MKFETFRRLLAGTWNLTPPEAAFYYWAAVPGGDDTRFARELLAATNITVLPGSFLSRDAHGVNPGRGFVRIALVSTVEETVEAAKRITEFVKNWAPAGVHPREPLSGAGVTTAQG